MARWAADTAATVGNLGRTQRSDSMVSMPNKSIWRWLARFLKEELRMELSMEKTRITDVRGRFRISRLSDAQEETPSSGRHVGMLFIPKGKSQFLRNKIKAR